jgi:hypothetical protein
VGRHHRQQSGAGVFEGELDRACIEDLDAVDNAVRRGVEGLLLGIRDALIIPAHGLGIEIGAIVEFDSLAQVEHIDLAAFQDLPGLGQVWHIIQFGVDAYQAVEQIAHDVVALGAGGEVGVQPRGICLPRYPQCPASLGLLRPGGEVH